MSYSDDKRELLKLKQGIIGEEESEIAKEEKHGYEKPRGKAAAENFFYHYKIHLIVAVFFTAVIAFLAYDALTGEKGDIRILTLASTDETAVALAYKKQSIEEAFELYTPNYDKNKYVHAENFYIDMTREGRDANAYYGNSVKLISEIRDGTAFILVGDMEIFEEITRETTLEIFFVNLEELYPGVPNVEGYFYRLKGTELADAANMLASCPENLYVAIRRNPSGSEENRARALEVFDNIVKGDKINAEP
ncbi:MAG: hypothetical protein LBI36_03725 [Oscillospiraceae bacterium]|jgi:hypothetical protein|nr:hypothetical protein [Oscillospiraceae bacterium]